MSIMGIQILESLSKAQDISGSEFQYLEKVSGNRTYVPPCWLCTIRDFLQKYNDKILIPQAWTPHIQ
eukprot:334584-Ditylum_brightwellii.AAC.1